MPEQLIRRHRARRALIAALLLASVTSTLLVVARVSLLFTAYIVVHTWAGLREEP